MNHKISLLFSILAVETATSAVISTLPTPVGQGGMIHINVTFDSINNRIETHLDVGTPVLKPLSLWSPGNTFDPGSPWYSTLDPTQGAGLFNSQYGLVFDVANSDDLPEGSKILVEQVFGTLGMETYQWKNTVIQAFNGILGTDGSSDVWDWSSVSTGMFHPMFVMPAGSSGNATVTLNFSLADITTGEILSIYDSGQATVNFEVVPETSTSLLAMIGGGLLLGVRRRKEDE